MKLPIAIQRQGLLKVLDFAGQIKPISLNYFQGRWSASMDINSKLEAPNVVFKDGEDPVSLIAELLRLYKPERSELINQTNKYV